MQNKLSISPRIHPWNVTPKRAMDLQRSLQRHWIGVDRFTKIRTVAGLDAAFILVGSQALAKPTNRWTALRSANRAIGCVVMYRYPEMVEVQRTYAILPLRYPYVPGFLSFREIPVLLAALSKLNALPDLLFCDGQGIAHPRRMGLATHLGIVLDLPTIGCAKSRLFGTYKEPAKTAGNWTPLRDPQTDRDVVGAVLRTRTGVSPIYVSQGNRVSLPTAIRLTLSVTGHLRIPRPTRDADRFAAEIKRQFLARQSSEK